MDGMNGTKNRVPLSKGHMLAYQMLGKEALANCLLFSSCQSHFRRHLHCTQMECVVPFGQDSIKLSQFPGFLLGLPSDSFVCVSVF